MSAVRLSGGLATRLLSAVAAGLGLILVAGCDEQPATERAEVKAEATSPPVGLEFEPPPPGSYELPPIQPAADGNVVAADGSEHRLFDYLGDRYVLLSFIYTRCSDGRGCPFATATFQILQRRLESDPDLAGMAEKVRLITLSFDPERDTPEAMEHFGHAAAGGGPGELEWVFLTTRSQAELKPILDGYGQYIVPETDGEGRFLGTFTHVLKVYLIDRELRVRNIYSTGFLHPQLALNDLETLVLEEAHG